jgi:hypothetical protein
MDGIKSIAKLSADWCATGVGWKNEDSFVPCIGYNAVATEHRRLKTLSIPADKSVILATVSRPIKRLAIVTIVIATGGGALFKISQGWLRDSFVWPVKLKFGNGAGFRAGKKLGWSLRTFQRYPQHGGYCSSRRGRTSDGLATVIDSGPEIRTQSKGQMMICPFFFSDEQRQARDDE